MIISKKRYIQRDGLSTYEYYNNYDYFYYQHQYAMDYVIKLEDFYQGLDYIVQVLNITHYKGANHYHKHQNLGYSEQHNVPYRQYYDIETKNL